MNVHLNSLQCKGMESIGRVFSITDENRTFPDNDEVDVEEKEEDIQFDDSDVLKY